MMAVSDVQRRNGVERHDELMLLGRVDRPDRVLHTVNRGEIEERRAAMTRQIRRVTTAACPIGQEHRSGLRAQLPAGGASGRPPCRAGVLVLPDDVAVVLVDRKAAGQTGLGVSAHPQPVHVERGASSRQERRLFLQRSKFATAFA